MRDLMPPHPRQPWLLICVFDCSPSSEVGLIMVFICISLMANDVEPLSMCFLAICRSSWALRFLKFHGVQRTSPLSWAGWEFCLLMQKGEAWRSLTLPFFRCWPGAPGDMPCLVLGVSSSCRMTVFLNSFLWSKLSLSCYTTNLHD